MCSNCQIEVVGRRDLLKFGAGAIGRMIEPILPAALAVRSDPGDSVNNAAKESAKRTAGRLASGFSVARRPLAAAAQSAGSPLADI